MKTYFRALLSCALLGSTGLLHAADPYADQVISYTPGTGFNTSYENTNAALGAPLSSATISAPPFTTSDIVGVGNGGQLTLAFNTPILNSPAGHASGMDFTIFGNDFFTFSSSAISGVFNHTGLSVWVSQDNITYYQLAAPYGADDYYPTQGDGDPSLPINPLFTVATFIGQTTAQALSLYNGSAGGASYSISWAEDSGGHPVDLPSISYIQIQGTSGFGYVDAVARVQDAPEPASGGLLLAGLGSLLGHRHRRAHRQSADPASSTTRS
jgi:hypothetical protein